MNKALIGAIVIAAGLTSTALAQTPKQALLKVALNRQFEYSTNFSDTQMVWKTKKDKVTEKTIISAIGAALNHGFTSKAQLTLEEALLGGFQNVDSLDGYPPGIAYPQFVYEDNAEGQVVRQGINQVDYSDPIPGKFQPMGWIFVRDQVGPNVYTFMDVTPFFNVSVHECYDCFYLNSFVTDTKLKFGEVTGPPCCGSSPVTSGTGTDRYYVCFEFDNTIANPRVVDGQEFGVYGSGGDWIRNRVATMLAPEEDGITPNMAPVYQSFDQSVVRFRVCGIMTYKWTLKESQFVGTATLPAYGYGFVKKVCSMFDGKITMSEYLAGNKAKTPAPSAAFESTMAGIYGPQLRYLFYGDEADYYFEGGPFWDDWDDETDDSTE